MNEFGKEGKGMLVRLTWLAIRIATVVALIVVPFGYAITGVHTSVYMGAGCGIAIGVGVGLRGGARSGPWTGILTGAIVGVATALIAGLFPGNRFGVLVPPVLALAVGLIAGFRGSSLSGYWDMSREAFIVCVLLALGFLPSWVAQGFFSPDSFSTGATNLVAMFLLIPFVALLAGLLSHRRAGWRDARPPAVLVLGAMAVPALLVFGMTSGYFQEGRGLSGSDLILMILGLVAVTIVVLPGVAFLLGRTVINWLEPRLRVYGYLADYLHVMWVPIGAFAIGYLTIIVLFAGFYGMLERFQPGAFADAGAGIADWLSFAFFTALGQDFAPAAPTSFSARALVGAHLILSAGWAVVLFAAVMSSIGPKLDQIARRHAEEGDD